MMDGGMMGAMGVGMLLVVATLLAVLVVTVLAGVWLVRSLRQGGRSGATRGDDSPHEALRRRYAAGEIDDDEFKRRLVALDER